MNERKVRTIAIVALMFVVICTTIAFSVLSQNLNINSAGKIGAGDWNIIFQKLNTKPSGNAKDESSEIALGSTIINLTPTLKLPGDKVTYKFEVANTGGMDAKLYEIIIDGDYELYPDINFSFHYDNDTDYENKVPDTNDTLVAGTSRPLIVVIEYDPGATSLHANDLNFTFSVQMIYVQDTTGTTPGDNGGELGNNGEESTTQYADGTEVYFNPTSGNKCNGTSDYVTTNSNTTNTTGCLKWYTFLDSPGATEIKLILDHNVTIRTPWGTTNATYGTEMIAAIDTLKNAWATVASSIRLISAEEIATITSLSNWNANVAGTIMFQNNSGSCSACGSLGKGNATYAWLFERTGSDCERYGCYNKTNTTSPNTDGYWTSTPRNPSGSTSSAWRVDYKGSLADSGTTSSSQYGLRPVIIVPKSILE